MNEKLFNPDYLGYLCRKYNLTPSKKYGQNYLINPTLIDTMLTAGEVSKKDVIVEVGPGFGALTEALVKKAGRVAAFEIEKKLFDYWEENKKTNLEMVWGNVLKNFSVIEKFGEYKVIANLPYQITSNVLRGFLECSKPPERLVVMVQKEVAERICAKPGDLSLLAIAVQYYATPEIVAKVSKNNFWPVPAVDSAVLKVVLKPLAEEARAEADRFFHWVKIGFAQKRKLLIKNLLPFVDKTKKANLKDFLIKLGYTSTVRAQEISLEDWKKLVIHLSVL